MTPLLAVGNDVVDLTDPRCTGRASDERFVARVFAPEEARAIEAAADPDLALWLRWAAKEAAFKVVSKLSGSPPSFTHAAFVSEIEAPGGHGAGAGGSGECARVAAGAGTEPAAGAGTEPAAGAGTEPAAGAAPLGGHVRYGTREIALRAHVTGEWLHVLAVPMGEVFDGIEAGVAAVSGADPDAGTIPAAADGAAWDAFLEARFSEAERPSIHSVPSALVRLRAREALCRHLGEEEGAVEIVCRGGPAGRTPPEVLVRGGAGRADASLSHHGRWVGWAVTGGER